MKLSGAIGSAALALSFALIASGCVSQDEKGSEDVANTTVSVAELSGVTLKVGDQKGITEPLLAAAGELDGLPYKVEFSMFTSGPPQVEAATGDKIDFAVTGNTPPIFGAANNANIKVVAAYQASGEGDKILIPKDSTLSSVPELKGKKIAVAKGSSAHANVLEQLDAVDVNVDDVELVFLQPADGLAAFQQGSVDAWAIWDPFTAIAEAQTGAKTLVDAEQSYAFGIASAKALADPKRNTALADLVQRIARATKWAQANEQEWANHYAQSVGVAPEVAQVAQERSIKPAVPLTDEVVASEQLLADLFYDSGQIPASPDFDSFVDRRYNTVLEPYFGT